MSPLRRPRVPGPCPGGGGGAGAGLCPHQPRLQQHDRHHHHHQVRTEYYRNNFQSCLLAEFGTLVCKTFTDTDGCFSQFLLGDNFLKLMFRRLLQTLSYVVCNDVMSNTFCFQSILRGVAVGGGGVRAGGGAGD